MRGAAVLLSIAWLAIGVPGVSAADQPLIEAARRGDLPSVRLLLAKSDVNATDVNGSTALHVAVEGNGIEIAQLLIAAGANTKAISRYGVAPLLLAATKGNARMIEQLLEAGADANTSSPEGQTALMNASATGIADAVTLLIRHGARVNAVETWKGQTALMWAASENNVAAVEALIKAGGDVRAKSKAGFTALLFAVRAGHGGAVKTLITAGANVNDTAADGTSAAGMAVVNAHYEVALMLLDRGANPNAPQPQGSILHAIAWMRRPGWNAQVDFTPPSPHIEAITLDVARSLLAHGANPNAQVQWKEIKYDRNNGVVKGPPNISVGRAFMTYVGATPLYLAARAADHELMRVLATAGGDPTIRTAQGVTPLMAAAGIGYWDAESPGPTSGALEVDRLEAVKVAIELGSDVNATADYDCPPLTGDPEWMLLNYPLNIADLPPGGDPRWNGATALHGAAMAKQPSIIRYLVEHGAKLDAKTRAGWTPLMVAKEVFVSNTRKEWPPSYALLKELMAQRGLNPQ